DLSDSPNVKEAHIQSAERCGSAMQCRIVLIAQCLGVGDGRRLIEAGESGWRLRWTSRRPARSSPKTAPSDISTAPPDSRQVGMTVGHPWRRFWSSSLSAWLLGRCKPHQSAGKCCGDHGVLHNPHRFSWGPNRPYTFPSEVVSSRNIPFT